MYLANHLQLTFCGMSRLFASFAVWKLEGMTRSPFLRHFFFFFGRNSIQHRVIGSHRKMNLSALAMIRFRIISVAVLCILQAAETLTVCPCGSNQKNAGFLNFSLTAVKTRFIRKSAQGFAEQSPTRHIRKAENFAPITEKRKNDSDPGRDYPIPRGLARVSKKGNRHRIADFV